LATCVIADIHIILMRLKNNFSILHPDGWFENFGDMVGTTEPQRRKVMVEFYSDYLRKYSYSEERCHYLQKTIVFLQSQGPVFLVRMPLHQEILEIEEKVDPDFDSKMNSLAAKNQIQYFDFNKIDHALKFKDGLHLNVDSAIRFSQQLANMIKYEPRQQ